MTPTEKLLAEQEKIVAERGYYIRPVRMANLMKAASRIFDSFTLEFLGETDDLVELDLSSLTDSVNLISPAHLRFIIAGLTWERFEAVNMTWQKLEDMNMTWERLEESVPIVGTKQ